MKVFYDVDTQKDFMMSNGKLPVPNAKDIISNLIYLRDYASRNKILLLGSVDRHFPDDEELKQFPPHCMDGTEGQRKLDLTLLRKSLVTYIRSKVGCFGKYDSYSANEMQIEIRNHQQIIFEKQQTDVFANRSIKDFLDKLRVSEAIVYGVATEFCVKDAVLGFLKLGIKVQVVSDAIKETNKNNAKKAIKEMKEKGAIFKTTNEIIKETIK